MVNDIHPGSSRVNYFDAHLDHGSSLVIVFHTSNPLVPDRPLEPFIAVHLDRPGSEPLSFESHCSVARLSVGAESCSIRIGGNSVRGDLTGARGMR
jgi:hypothetical protein